jgi:hypothetical protein
MTVPLTDLNSPVYDGSGPLTRRARMRVAVVILVCAVVLAAGWILYNRPAHPYPVRANSATWTSDVRLAIAESKPVGPIHPTGPLRHLPGVGTIVSVIVDKGVSDHQVAVLFMTNEGVGESGLAYLKGFPPPPDSCDVHLSGPWWQIGPLNLPSNNCARGFHYTEGG